MEVGPLLETDVRQSGLIALQQVLGDSENLCFARRPNGSPLLLRQGFFERLLKREVTFASCLASDLVAAQADIRHLTLTQLLQIRCDNIDHQASSCVQAQGKFLSCIDERIEQCVLARLSGTSGLVPCMEPSKTKDFVHLVFLFYGAHSNLAARDGDHKNIGTWLVRFEGISAILQLATCELCEIEGVDTPTFCPRSLSRATSPVPKAKRRIHWHVEVSCDPGSMPGLTAQPQQRRASALQRKSVVVPSQTEAVLHQDEPIHAAVEDHSQQDDSDGPISRDNAGESSQITQFENVLALAASADVLGEGSCHAAEQSCNESHVADTCQVSDQEAANVDLHGEVEQPEQNFDSGVVETKLEHRNLEQYDAHVESNITSEVEACQPEVLDGEDGTACSSLFLSESQGTSPQCEQALAQQVVTDIIASGPKVDTSEDSGDAERLPSPSPSGSGNEDACENACIEARLDSVGIPSDTQDQSVASQSQCDGMSQLGSLDSQVECKSTDLPLDGSSTSHAAFAENPSVHERACIDANMNPGHGSDCLQASDVQEQSTCLHCDVASPAGAHNSYKASVDSGNYVSGDMVDDNVSLACANETDISRSGVPDRIVSSSECSSLQAGCVSHATESECQPPAEDQMPVQSCQAEAPKPNICTSAVSSTTCSSPRSGCDSILDDVRATYKHQNASCDGPAYITALEQELQNLRMQLAASEEARSILENRLSAVKDKSDEGPLPIGVEADVTCTKTFDISEGDDPEDDNDLAELFDMAGLDVDPNARGTTHLLNCSRDSRRQARGSADKRRKLLKMLKLPGLFKKRDSSKSPSNVGCQDPTRVK